MCCSQVHIKNNNYHRNKIFLCVNNNIKTMIKILFVSIIIMLYEYDLKKSPSVFCRSVTMRLKKLKHLPLEI